MLSTMVTDGSTMAREEPRVAASDVEPVVVEQPVKIDECLVDALAPFPDADPPQCRVADLLVIGLALAERMVRQLRVRHQPPVEEQARADAGAERDDELEPGAAHDLETLEICVVGDADGSAETCLQRAGEIEPCPRSQQLGHDRRSGAPERVTKCGAVSTMPLRTTPLKADRHAVEVRQGRNERSKGVDEVPGCARIATWAPGPGPRRACRPRPARKP